MRKAEGLALLRHCEEQSDEDRLSLYDYDEVLNCFAVSFSTAFRPLGRLGFSAAGDVAHRLGLRATGDQPSTSAKKISLNGCA